MCYVFMFDYTTLESLVFVSKYIYMYMLYLYTIVCSSIHGRGNGFNDEITILAK